MLNMETLVVGLLNDMQVFLTSDSFSFCLITIIRQYLPMSKTRKLTIINSSANIIILCTNEVCLVLGVVLMPFRLLIY